MPTAIARENSTASMSGRCSTTLITKIDAVSTPATQASSSEKRRSPSWNSVSSLPVAQPHRDRARTRCRGPVATTTPSPVPALHDRAHERAGGQVASGRAGRHRRGGPSRPAADSPVSTDSSHSSPSPRAAAGRPGTIVPRPSRTTSPGTRSVTSTAAAVPAAHDQRAVADPVVQRRAAGAPPGAALHLASACGPGRRGLSAAGRRPRVDQPARDRVRRRQLRRQRVQREPAGLRQLPPVHHRLGGRVGGGGGEAGQQRRPARTSPTVGCRSRSARPIGQPDLLADLPVDRRLQRLAGLHEAGDQRPQLRRPVRVPDQQQFVGAAGAGAGDRDQHRGGEPHRHVQVAAGAAAGRLAGHVGQFGPAGPAPPVRTPPGHHGQRPPGERRRPVRAARRRAPRQLRQRPGRSRSSAASAAQAGTPSSVPTGTQPGRRAGRRPWGSPRPGRSAAGARRPAAPIARRGRRVAASAPGTKPAPGGGTAYVERRRSTTPAPAGRSKAAASTVSV